MLPVCTPSSETRPARRPCAAARAVMYRTAGPGMTNKTNAVTTNSGRTDGDGTLDAMSRPDTANDRFPASSSVVSPRHRVWRCAGGSPRRLRTRAGRLSLLSSPEARARCVRSRRCTANGVIRVAAAVGEGAISVPMIHHYLINR
jgi:hypothetical protein